MPLLETRADRRMVLADLVRRGSWLRLCLVTISGGELSPPSAMLSVVLEVLMIALLLDRAPGADLGEGLAGALKDRGLAG